jgi:hypothetical protein
LFKGGHASGRFELSLRSREGGGRVHQAERLAILLHRLGEFGVWLKLVYATDTKIRRHVKIRAEANPYDPDWRNYFVERAFFKKFGIHRQEAGIKPS